ncbi:hypothetical protein [Romboutsia lituseburensis]|uniref:hypothetical protein n=1 Tax=Romboutsia lituseburensis TaxID=1537 RepID=UPI00215A94CE|nr:hypothetical protein [Romboutsia lituseburensis]MCR8745228.1 hypothetical protein [Romboutsia lituseburensis]
MGDMELILISIGLLVAIMGGVGILYWTQKQDNSLYNKVTKLITNGNVKKMVDILTVLTLVMLAILLIALELSIFLPSVEWGWLDRNTLITTFATIIGGFFGFIGASIGIIGTYGAFYLGVNKEKEKEEKHKRTMLFNLLECTVNKTSGIVKVLSDMSNNYGTLVYMDEEEVVCEKVREVMAKVSNDEYDDMFEFAIKAIIFGGQSISLLPKNRYGSRLEIEFNELIEQRSLNLNIIIYDENWVSYLDCLNDSKSIQNVINWINLLRNDALGYDVVDFLVFRNKIIKIIDDNEPSVKDGSIRGLRERNRKLIDKIIREKGKEDI